MEKGSPSAPPRDGENFWGEEFSPKGETRGYGAVKGKTPRTRLKGGRIRFLGECARRGRRPLQKQAGPPEGGRHGGEGMPRGSFLLGREGFGVGGVGGRGGGADVGGGVRLLRR